MTTGQRTSKPLTKTFLGNPAISEPQEDITDPPHAPPLHHDLDKAPFLFF